MTCDECGSFGPCKQGSKDESPLFRTKWCDVCGQLEGRYFTEVYDPSMDEVRTYWLCHECQAELSEKFRDIVNKGMVS